jgi:hypothetical protein
VNTTDDLAHVERTPAHNMHLGNHKRAVLIGFGEALSAPEVAWDLLRHGFQVMAFCRRGTLPPLRRIKGIRFIEVTAPEIDAWETVEQIRSAVQRGEISTLVPLDDASIWLCDKVSTGVRVPVAGATGEAARLAIDKRYQLDAASEAGFNVPETQYVTERRELLKIERLPVVIKPAAAIAEIHGRLCKGPISFCIEREDVIREADDRSHNGPMIVQPVLPGIGEGIFGLHGPGGVRNWSAHRRVRMVNPLGSGSSACMSLKISDQPMQASERMLRKVEWPAMFMIELLRDPKDKLWFMELNGRSWGSMALAVRLGLHYPAWTVMQTLDPDFVPPATPPWRSIVCRHLGREIIHVLAVLKGKKTYKLLPNYSRMRTLVEVCRFNRNDEWYNWHAGHSLLFWEDTIKAVMGKVFSNRG